MVLTGQVLIDVAALADRLATDPPTVTVLDVRWRMAGPPGRNDHRAGHIPGAHFVDLDAELAGPPGPGGRHPLPDPAVVQAAMRRAGLHAGTTVVGYDDGDGVAAARLWWVLRWAGHAGVLVLDGGFAAWLGAGRPVSADPVPDGLGTWTVQPGGLPVLDADGAASVARTGALLDARVAARFRGETEPIDPVAGHIPGACNLPPDRLSGPDGRLASAEALRAVFADSGVRPDAPVGAYCGSGVTAALTVLALHRAGFTHAALYVGSWSDWITDPGRPVALGAGEDGHLAATS
jgi:thiosulfate/3-mercaptopyruvate sulfurtransferase